MPVGRPSKTIVDFQTHIKSKKLQFSIVDYETPIHTQNSNCTIKYACGHLSNVPIGYILYKKLECRECKPTRISKELFQTRVHLKHPHVKVTSFSAIRKPASFKCSLDGHTWTTVATDFHGCKKCSDSNKRYTFIEFTSLLPKTTQLISSEVEYKKHIYVFKCTVCLHTWKPTSLRSARQHGFPCPSCAKLKFKEKATKKHSHFVKELNDLNPAIKVVGRYLGANKKLEVCCIKCNHSWDPVPSSLLYGSGCPACAKCYSKSSISWLKKCNKALRLRIKHFENSGEFKIPNTRYKADGYNSRHKIVFEFLGDYWHGNPKIFSSVSAKQRLNKTIARTNALLSLGYTVVYIWENDYLLGKSYHVVSPNEIFNDKLIEHGQSYQVKKCIRSLRC